MTLPLLNIGKSVWVSAMIQQAVDLDTLAANLKRHRRYELSNEMALSDATRRQIYEVNKEAMALVMEYKETDASGWRPRFSSMWTHPLGISTSGAPRSLSYWIVSDITQLLKHQGEPLGTVILTNRELRWHGSGIYSGHRQRDVDPTIEALGCTDMVYALGPYEAD